MISPEQTIHGVIFFESIHKLAHLTQVKNVFSFGENIVSVTTKEIAVWNSEGQLVRKWRSPERLLSACDVPATNEIWSGTTEGRIHVWKLQYETPAETIHVFDVKDSVSGTLANMVQHASKYLDTKVKVWVTELVFRNKFVIVAYLMKIHLWNPVWNDWIVLGGKSARGGSFLSVYDMAGKHINNLSGHKGNIRDLTIWNGKLVSASADKTIRIWDTNGKCERTLEGHRSQVNCVEVFGGFLCSGGNDNKIFIWTATEVPLFVGVRCLCTWKGKLVAGLRDGGILVLKGNIERTSSLNNIIPSKEEVSPEKENKEIEENDSDDAPKSEKMKSYNDSFEGEWKWKDELPQIQEKGSFGVVTLDKVKHKQMYENIMEMLADIKEYKVQKIEYIVSNGQERMFNGCIEKVEKREKLKEFQPNLEIESNPDERKRVLNMITEISKKTVHNRNVKIAKTWHGTSADFAHQIVDVGFASLAKLDQGWFGKGIYFTTHPKYALRYCKEPACLILSYSILLNPYPIIWEDATSSSHLKFYAKGNYKNYGSHYVPVVPYGSEESTMDFRPPQIGQLNKYDEVVVFHEEHILPKFIVYLEKQETVEIPKTPSTPSSELPQNFTEWDVEKVADWLSTLKLTKDYSEVIRREGIDGTVLSTMEEKDLKTIGIVAFGDVKKIEMQVSRRRKN